MDQARHAVRRLFDAIAPTYDQTGVSFFGPIATGLVDALAPTTGERALVMGCGRGAELIPIAERVGATGAVLGGDLSPNMVAACRAAAADRGLGHVEVRELDAQDPGLDERPFDLVASSLVLPFLPDPGAALAAWVPLLRPGGRAGVTTFRGPDPVIAAVEGIFEPYLPPGMLDARRSGAIGPFASDAGVEGLLTGAGFAQVSTVSGTVHPVYDDAEHWYRFSMSVGMRQFWGAVPDEDAAAVRAEVLDRVTDLAEPDGRITAAVGVRHTLGRRPGSTGG